MTTEARWPVLYCEEIGMIGYDAHGRIFAVTDIDDTGRKNEANERPTWVLALIDARTEDGRPVRRGTLMHHSELRSPIVWKGIKL